MKRSSFLQLRQTVRVEGTLLACSRSSTRVGAEDLAPLLDIAVGGRDGLCTLIAGVDQLKEQVRSALRNGVGKRARCRRTYRNVYRVSDAFTPTRRRTGTVGIFM